MYKYHAKCTIITSLIITVCNVAPYDCTIVTSLHWLELLRHLTIISWPPPGPLHSSSPATGQAPGCVNSGAKQ